MTGADIFKRILDDDAFQQAVRDYYAERARDAVGGRCDTDQAPRIVPTG